MRWLLWLALVVSSVLVADECPTLFASLQSGKDFQKLARRLPEMPAPLAVESWFRSVFDPQNKKGDALILDPAFRNAFQKLVSEEIEKSDLKEKDKNALRDGLKALLEDLSKRAAPHSADAPLPAELKPTAVAERTARYQGALQDFWKTEGFRNAWASSLRSYPTLDKVEEHVRDFYRSNITGDPKAIQAILDGKSPMAVSELARDTLKQIALDRIEKAWLPKADKEKLRRELDEALKAWDREHKLRQQEVAAEPDTLKLTADQEKALKKKLEEYLKSEQFRKCVTQPGLLIGASEAITVAGFAAANTDSLGDKNKSFWQNMTDPATYWHALESSTMQKQLIWNGLLMASIGGLACIKTEAFAGDKKLMRWALRPANFNGFILSPMMAAIAELSSGKFNAGNVLLGALWVRYISVNKTALANKLAATWKDKGYPFPYSFYFITQLASETIGAVGYPLLHRFLFGAPDDDDDKKKKKLDPKEAIIEK